MPFAKVRSICVNEVPYRFPNTFACSEKVPVCDHLLEFRLGNETVIYAVFFRLVGTSEWYGKRMPQYFPSAKSAPARGSFCRRPKVRI